MEIDINLNENKIPAYILAFITLKVLYVAFTSLFGEMATPDTDVFAYMPYITDNYLWIPMLVFIVYFYLYRKAKISDQGLNYAILCALISIVPKLILLVVSLYLGVIRSSWQTHLYIVELVIWVLMYMHLISFWYSKLKLKDHHHHHHHHSSSYHHHHTTSPQG